MSGRAITKGATDQSTIVRIIDDTTGVPEEAVEHNSSGIAFWYRREGGLKVAITLAALSALNDAHSDGGIEHIDDGYYRLDLPDAAVASGATGVMVGGFVTGMVVIGTYHSLVDFNSEGQSAIDLKDFADDGYDPSTNKVQGVVLTDTVTTYTGNTPQTGDAFARLGAPAGASVSADVAAVKSDSAAILADTGTDGVVVAAGGIVAGSFAAGAIDAAALAADAGADIADALLDRDMSTGADSGSATVRTVRQALRFLRNKWSLSGTTLTVTKEDDTTASWTATVTTDAAADPITASDPAGP